MRTLVALVCIALALAGGFARFTSAAFTNALAVPSNALGVDQLSNHFSATPGSAVQAGTSTPIASGNVNSMTLAFGTVPSARTFTSVFQVTNVTGSSQTATMTLSGAPQISSVVFASSGTTTATLAAGASTTVTVTTSNTVAGHGSGTLQLGLSGLSWMYRTYNVTIDEQPEAPPSLTATAAAAGRINLSWGASTTTTNFAGYNVYRSTGGAYTKLTASPIAATTYADTATTNGTTYTYKVRGVSTDATPLESLDSPTASATADSTPPTRPTSVSLANGGGSGGAYINIANSSSLSVSVALASGWLSTDTVSITLSSGSSSITKNANPSSSTVIFTGIDLSSFGDGTVSISATQTDLAGNVSTARSASFVKDTSAPSISSASFNDRNNNTKDQILGTTEAGATVKATESAPNAGSTFSATANGSGSFTITVEALDGNPTPINYSYSVTATDAAGNTGPAKIVSGTATK
ncbi:MAG TPA: Ig-like domain-containing protein [Gaiellaceae bacterium]|nr:Ig-like domain-containing protein [Gaiellaceae bacterium]